MGERVWLKRLLLVAMMATSVTMTVLAYVWQGELAGTMQMPFMAVVLFYCLGLWEDA